MATITAPVKGFNGLVGGVEFKDSVANTDNEQVITYCQRAGYAVEFDGGSRDGAPDESWKVADLTEWAKAHDCNLGGARSKADILAAITDPGNEKTAVAGELLPVVPADPSVEQTDLTPSE